VFFCFSFDLFLFFAQYSGVVGLSNKQNYDPSRIKVHDSHSNFVVLSVCLAPHNHPKFLLCRLLPSFPSVEFV
jgi:hypothetical protein